jgi:hypothetical protein
MPLYTPSFGGVPIFGDAVHIVVLADELARQEDAYAGVPGVLSLTLSSRGRRFMIDGVLSATDIPTVAALADVFQAGVPGSLADGIARTLTDTIGRSWANVVCMGTFEPDPTGPHPLAGGGWMLAYRTVFRGLS